MGLPKWIKRIIKRFKQLINPNYEYNYDIPDFFKDCECDKPELAYKPVDSVRYGQIEFIPYCKRCKRFFNKTKLEEVIVKSLE